jgi:hypothetical protein
LADGRTSDLQMGFIENFKKDALKINVKEIVEKETSLKTDKFKSYAQMKKEGMEIK